MKNIYTALVLIIFCGCAVANPTTQDASHDSVQSQNQEFQEFLSGLSSVFQCPKSVVKEIDKVTKLSAASPNSSAAYLVRSIREPTFATMRKDNPSAYAAIKSNPAMMKTMADSMQMPVADFEHLLDSGTVAEKRVPAFMSRTSANLAITNQVPSFCNKQCEDDIGWNTVLSVILWRNVCMLCNDDFLTVISLGDKHWVDTRALDWLKAPGTKSPASFPLKHLPLNRTKSGENSSAGNSTKKSYESKNDSSVYYELVADTDLTDTLCGASLTKGERPPGLLALQGTLCKNSPSTAQLEASTMSIVLKPGATSCGAAKSFIACAQTSNAVELTFEKTRYSFFDVFGSKKIAVGDPDAIELSGLSVIYHEVGHWFGLAHVDGQAFKSDLVPDVMQDTYLEHGCVSLISMSLISGMDEDSYQKRLNVGSGLRRPEPKTTH